MSNGGRTKEMVGRDGTGWVVSKERQVGMKQDGGLGSVKVGAG